MALTSRASSSCIARPMSASLFPSLGFYGAFGEAPVLEEGAYESLMGGDQAYTTADQFHNALWTNIPVFNEPEFDSTTQKFYLGDTQCALFVKVPPALYGSADNAAIFRPENVGISPNGDGYLDAFQMGLGLKRNAENIHYTVTNRKPVNSCGARHWIRIQNLLF